LSRCSSPRSWLRAFGTREPVHGVRADPGRYEFFNCEQLAVQRVAGKAREQELKQLMNRAEQGAGGTLVNVIAYKGDYVAVTEELKVIDMTLRVKKMPDRGELGQ
jgi:hypothetical protein